MCVHCLSIVGGFSCWQKLTFVGILIWVNVFACGDFSFVAKVSSYGDLDLDECLSIWRFMFLNKTSSCWESSFSIENIVNLVNLFDVFLVFVLIFKK